MPSAIAAGGVFLLAVLAPFEMTMPLVRVPGQSLTNVEAALLASCVAWAAAAVWTARWPRRGLPLAVSWFGFVAAMGIAAAAATAQRANAAHMVGRLAAAGAVYLLAVEGLTTNSRLRTAAAIAVGSGTVVALLAILEYLQVTWVLDGLRLFRPSVTAVGAQIRAGGPLQYPTIASMYLEIVFAFGIGLMIDALDRANRARAVTWFGALIVIAEAITFTFTRAGVITIAVSLAFAGVWRWRTRGVEAGVGAVTALAVVVAALVVSSRSTDSLWLRMTSEGQDAWYRAEVAAPPALAFKADETRLVAVTVRNAGRLAWDPSAAPEIAFSYHWLDAEGVRVVAYEGSRTMFDKTVAPGDAVIVNAAVRAPVEPGRYRIEWDLVQEGRLWFSTEQDAPDPFMSSAVVSGRGRGVPLPTTPRPARAVRPGRKVLWLAALRMIAAHPFLGVGPDNFRLLYGSYAGLSSADVRTHSNNMYLEVLAGGGVLAFAFFAWFLRRAYAVIAIGVGPGSDPGRTRVRPLALGVAAAGIAIALHAMVDSFLSFAPTYILFALTLGFATAIAGGEETLSDAHRV